MNSIPPFKMGSFSHRYLLALLMEQQLLGPSFFSIRILEMSFKKSMCGDVEALDQRSTLSCTAYWQQHSVRAYQSVECQCCSSRLRGKKVMTHHTLLRTRYMPCAVLPRVELSSYAAQVRQGYLSGLRHYITYHYNINNIRVTLSLCPVRRRILYCCNTAPNGLT